MQTTLHSPSEKIAHLQNDITHHNRGFITLTENNIAKINEEILQLQNGTYYDYRNQVWIVGGRYQDCNHPNGMGCGCFGRAHAGEVAVIHSEVH